MLTSLRFIPYRLQNQLVGFSALWYLTFFTSQSGVFTAAPVLIAGLASCFAKPADRSAKPNLKWALALSLFGLYSALTVWLNDGTNRDLETAAKYFIGGILAWRLATQSIDIRWIKAGGVLGALITIYLVATQYTGQSRFTAFGNVIKWGNLTSYQVLLLLCIAIIDKSWKLKAVYLALAFGCGYATALTGTRGAFLPWLGLIVSLLIIFRKRLSWRSVSVGLIILGTTLATLKTVPQFNQRLNHSLKEAQNVSAGNFIGSLGYRLTMWDVGIQAGLESPILGFSYDMRDMWQVYQPTVKGMESSSKRISNWTSKLHNTYVDTFSSKGLIGMGLLFLMVFTAFRGRTGDQKLLLLSPVLGVCCAGIADSTFDLGPTSEFFIITTTLFTVVTTSRVASDKTQLDT